MKGEPDKCNKWKAALLCVGLATVAAGLAALISLFVHWSKHSNSNLPDVFAAIGSATAVVLTTVVGVYAIFCDFKDTNHKMTRHGAIAIIMIIVIIILTVGVQYKTTRDTLGARDQLGKANRHLDGAVSQLQKLQQLSTKLITRFDSVGIAFEMVIPTNDPEISQLFRNLPQRAEQAKQAAEAHQSLPAGFRVADETTIIGPVPGTKIDSVYVPIESPNDKAMKLAYDQMVDYLCRPGMWIYVYNSNKPIVPKSLNSGQNSDLRIVYPATRRRMPLVKYNFNTKKFIACYATYESGQLENGNGGVTSMSDIRKGLGFSIVFKSPVGPNESHFEGNLRRESCPGVVSFLFGSVPVTLFQEGFKSVKIGDTYFYQTLQYSAWNLENESARLPKGRPLVSIVCGGQVRYARQVGDKDAAIPNAAENCFSNDIGPSFTLRSTHHRSQSRGRVSLSISVGWSGSPVPMKSRPGFQLNMNF